MVICAIRLAIAPARMPVSWLEVARTWSQTPPIGESGKLVIPTVVAPRSRAAWRKLRVSWVVPVCDTPKATAGLGEVATEVIARWISDQEKLIRPIRWSFCCRSRVMRPLEPTPNKSIRSASTGPESPLRERLLSTLKRLRPEARVSEAAGDPLDGALELARRVRSDALTSTPRYLWVGRYR